MKKIDLQLLAKSNPPQSIRKHTDELLEQLKILFALGYLSKEEFSLAERACEYHDYGKINDQFQERISASLGTSGYDKRKKMDTNEEIYHNLLSPFFINPALFSNTEDYIIVLNAVLNHHHYTNNIKFLEDNKNAIVEKLNEYEIYPIKSKVRKKISNCNSKVKAIFILGILMKCDYAASGGIPIEYPNYFLEKCLTSLFLKWKKEKISEGLNELQLFCLNHKERNLMITAPTGMGKTEASLLWCGNGKCFYVLPLKTAINSMYLRIREEVLRGEEIEKRLALLHSDSFSFLHQISKESGVQSQEVDTEDMLEYINLGKKLALPITICTPDQLFNFVFRYSGYELKLATLTYGKVIIDEIQAYNAELLAYIVNGIHQIMNMGGKIAIFTATLPPYVDYLIHKPVSTAIFIPDFLKQDFTKQQVVLRHKVKIINDKINIEMILKQFKEKTCKILVVCNTVRQAQSLYRDILEAISIDPAFQQEQVKMLHGKFIQQDRANKEKEILEDGQTNQNNKAVIWVTTQIVEASLDIDFDYLFTELSELNGLFQRMGRCNRKGIKKIEHYNCYVFTEINEKLLISQYDSNRGFIDKKIHFLSKEALKNVDGFITEEEKKHLLDKYLTFENLKESAFLKEFQKKYEYITSLEVGDESLREVDKRFRRIKTRTIIPKEIYEENIHKIEELIDALQNESSKCGRKRLQKIQNIKDEITKYSVGVGYFEVSKAFILNQIQLDKFVTIEIVDCYYNQEIGYVRKEIDTKEQNDDTDTIMGIFL